MSADRLIIRAAGAADAAALAGMLDAMNVEDGQPPGRFHEETVRRDGFGGDPAFSALLACVDERPVGYALYLPFYNTELARRGLWMLDASLWWTVRNNNAAARAFYLALGAKDDDTRLLELDGAALVALAAAYDHGAIP